MDKNELVRRVFSASTCSNVRVSTVYKFVALKFAPFKRLSIFDRDYFDFLCLCVCFYVWFCIQIKMQKMFEFVLKKLSESFLCAALNWFISFMCISGICLCNGYEKYSYISIGLIACVFYIYIYICYIQIYICWNAQWFAFKKKKKQKPNGGNWEEKKIKQNNDTELERIENKNVKRRNQMAKLLSSWSFCIVFISFCSAFNSTTDANMNMYTI